MARTEALIVKPSGVARTSSQNNVFGNSRKSSVSSDQTTTLMAKTTTSVIRPLAPIVGAMAPATSMT